MLGNLFSKDLRAAVLQEQNCATAGTSLRLRPREQVGDILNSLRAPLVVIKPIVESQWAPELLTSIRNSRVLWMYREYNDVVKSNVKRFHSQIEGLRIAVEGSPPSWRNERLSEATRHLQRKHYRPEMTREDAAAIGWCARNALFFELGLDRRDDVLLVKYEELVRHPQKATDEIYRFLELPTPRRSIADEVDARSIGRGVAADISSEIAEACRTLAAQFDKAFMEQRNRFDVDVGRSKRLDRRLGEAVESPTY